MTQLQSHPTHGFALTETHVVLVQVLSVKEPLVYTTGSADFYFLGHNFYWGEVEAVKAQREFLSRRLDELVAETKVVSAALADLNSNYPFSTEGKPMWEQE